MRNPDDGIPGYGTLWKMVWSGSSWRTNSRPRALNLSSRDSRSSGRDRFNLGATTAYKGCGVVQVVGAPACFGSAFGFNADRFGSSIVGQDTDPEFDDKNWKKIIVEKI